VLNTLYPSPNAKRGLIAASEGLSHQAVALILQEFTELEKLAKSAQTLAMYGDEAWYQVGCIISKPCTNPTTTAVTA
jgi:hypothetical protein